MANLTARQQRFYIHRCRIFRAVPQFDQTDVDTGTRWEMLADQVPSWFTIHVNADEISGAAARLAFDSILTLDEVYFAVDATVDSDDILANQTLEADGVTPSANYGFFWRVRGPARCFSSNRRHAGRKMVLAYREKVPPQGVALT